MLIRSLTLRVKDSATEAEIAAFGEAIADLPGQVGVPRTRQGPDLGDRSTNADDAVVTEFRSTEDFDACLAHPAYRALPMGRIESVHGVEFLVDEE
ncbi:Dabb family protein [Nocardioides immobilis]|uniref:Dabb family protein n=1 Tax=Nocardioides immobilis TaxID=2049295 RepID=UPI001C7103D1|nr:Dabb family protein [Nocardioides immobilis]